MLATHSAVDYVKLPAEKLLIFLKFHGGPSGSVCTIVPQNNTVCTGLRVCILYE